MKEIPNMKLRLLGLRATNLVSTKKIGIDFFGRHKTTTAGAAKPTTATNDQEEWEVWPEEEFEEAARQERDDEMNELEVLSQEYEKQQQQHNTINPNEPPPVSPTQEPWMCPICSLPQPPNDATFNAHIDFCLSRQTIKEAVQSTAPQTLGKQTSVSKTAQKKGKRGRPKHESPALDQQAREKKRLFFSFGGA